MAEKETKAIKKKTNTNVKNDKNSSKKNVKPTTKTNTKSNSSKTTQVKKTTQTKTTPNKTQSKKNTQTKVNTSKKSNKVAPKNTNTNKPKKVQPKKEVVKKVEHKQPEVDLEKTLIFDGRQNQNLAEVVEKLEEENVVLEDKIIKRSKAKKIIIIILTILIALVIASTTYYVINNELAKAEANQTLNSNIYKKVVKNYRTIGNIKESSGTSEDDIEYDNIKTITLSEFEKKVFEKEDMTILIASTTCYHCITFEPTISEVFKAQDKTVYRINITALSDEEIERFRTYYAFEITPTIFKIENGIAVSEITGSISAEDLTTWVQENA